MSSNFVKGTWHPYQSHICQTFMIIMCNVHLKIPKFTPICMPMDLFSSTVAFMRAQLLTECTFLSDHVAVIFVLSTY